MSNQPQVPQIEVKDFAEASKRFTEVYFALGSFQSALARASQAFSEQDGKWISNFLLCEAILSLLEENEEIALSEWRLQHGGLHCRHQHNRRPLQCR